MSTSTCINVSTLLVTKKLFNQQTANEFKIAYYLLRFLKRLENEDALADIISSTLFSIAFVA